MPTLFVRNSHPVRGRRCRRNSPSQYEKMISSRVCHDTIVASGFVNNGDGVLTLGYISKSNLCGPNPTPQLRWSQHSMIHVPSKKPIATARSSANPRGLTLDHWADEMIGLAENHQTGGTGPPEPPRIAACSSCPVQS